MDSQPNESVSVPRASISIPTLPPVLEQYPESISSRISSYRVIHTTRPFHASSSTVGPILDRRPSRPRASEATPPLFRVVESEIDLLDRLEWHLYDLPRPSFVETSSEEEEEGEGEVDRPLSHFFDRFTREPLARLHRPSCILQRAVRQWYARHRLLREQKLFIRRQRVHAEIFETEQTYLEHLHVAEAAFQQPLLTLVHQGRVSTADYRKIFGTGYLNIRAVHVRFFRVLERVLLENQGPHYRERPVLSEAFNVLLDHVTSYRSYCAGYKTSLQTWSRLKKDPTIAPVLRRWERNPATTGLGLISYLILPVSRIPRYRLLLRDLLKCIPKEDPDYLSLKRVLRLTCLTSEFINHSFLIMEMDDSLKTLSEKFLPFETDDGFQILSSSRVELTSSEVGFWDSSCHRWTTGMLFVFDDSALVAKYERGDMYSYVDHLVFDEDTNVFICESHEFSMTHCRIGSPSHWITLKNTCTERTELIQRKLYSAIATWRFRQFDRSNNVVMRRGQDHRRFECRLCGEDLESYVAGERRKKEYFCRKCWVRCCMKCTKNILEVGEFENPQHVCDCCYSRFTSRRKRIRTVWVGRCRH